MFILLYFITKLNESSLNLMTANMQSMPKMLIIMTSADIADFTVHYHACVVVLAGTHPGGDADSAVIRAQQHTCHLQQT